MTLLLADVLELGEDTVEAVLIAGAWHDVKREPDAIRPCVRSGSGWLQIELPDERELLVPERELQAVRVNYRDVKGTTS